MTWESPDLSTDLLPGLSPQFSFEGVLAPVQFIYIATGLDDSQTVSGTNTGQIASPGIASVPEPGGLVLLRLRSRSPGDHGPAGMAGNIFAYSAYREGLRGAMPGLRS